MQAQVQPFFDPDTSTVSYVVYDRPGGHAAIIDPVLDLDYASGSIGTASAQVLIDFVTAQQLSLQWILETHAHADHLSAAVWLRQQLGGRIAVGERIVAVQQRFGELFNLGEGFAADGRQFDHLLMPGERFRIGTLSALALFVPGHTPADMAYLVEDAVFVGDTLFMPDVGTARCDFPGGSASALWHSVQDVLYALPEQTRVFVCHDYLPQGRTFPRWESTIGEQKRKNIHLRADTGEAEFVARREARDANLALPRLILPALQVNIRAGMLPCAEANGRQYLKIPLNAF
ncbi:MBL fold metallo-hydrolase [Chitiniphilus purpureus]|uniref:MBL fold metallo-hydrolase n=1 Tax=Chitiniphilus purpureus TaxID=2981137 RepID=A0ABY6DK70_9NEIS|nr:MBL fold metallo-hydrolase [Chitiniphilus sp. CD1]UXY14432.1 MBL fold metallo-hydrolase [Chitiniphilus sp. CD1]